MITLECDEASEVFTIKITLLTVVNLSSKLASGAIGAPDAKNLAFAFDVKDPGT